jgi:hypothetical protein
VSALHDDVPNVIAGAATSEVERVAPRVRLAAGFAGALATDVAMGAHDFAHCAAWPSAAAPPTINVTQWTGDGFGYHFEGMVRALHRAACCGGVAVLPRTTGRCRDLWAPTAECRVSCQATMPGVAGSRRRRDVCFNFSAVPRVAPSDGTCRPRVDGSSDYFYESGVAEEARGGHPCPTLYYYMRPALRAAAAYAALPRALGCPAGVDFGRTLVAHVRGGDIFGDDTHYGYGQPPLAYYLAAWERSALPTLLVLSEDAGSPITQALSMLARALPASGGRSVVVQQSGSRFERDLAPMVCAQHLVVSETSLNRVILANNAQARPPFASLAPDLRAPISLYASRLPLPSHASWPAQLRVVYSHQKLHPNVAWPASCATRVMVGEAVPRAYHWANKPEQRLALVLDGWESGFNFTQQPPAEVHCLGLEARRGNRTAHRAHTAKGGSSGSRRSRGHRAR